MTGGIEVVRQTDTFDVRWGDLTGRTRRLELAAAKSWLTLTAPDGGQTLVSWCDRDEIGIFSKAFQLGRVRTATPLDLKAPLHLSDYSAVHKARLTPNVETETAGAFWTSSVKTLSALSHHSAVQTVTSWTSTSPACGTSNSVWPGLTKV